MCFISAFSPLCEDARQLHVPVVSVLHEMLVYIQHAFFLSQVFFTGFVVAIYLVLYAKLLVNWYIIIYKLN